MRLLSRALFTFALLGGLAYGSYAFGKYVLSSHLFGPQGEKLKANFEGTENATVTAKGSDITGSPRASVEVLPADNGDAESAPPLSSLERRRRPDSALPEVTITDPPKIDESELSKPSDDNNDDEDRPRRRRRRRTRPTPEPVKPDTRSQEPARNVNEGDSSSSSSDSGSNSSSSSETPTVSSEDNSSGSSSSSNNSSGDGTLGGRSEPALAPRIEPREERPRESAPSETPRRRRRERVRTDSTVVTREDTPRAAPRPA
ncbi:hypothetical protein EON80_19755, partial [bacterium]